jgi:outer membrane autotransporter protein
MRRRGFLVGYDRTAIDADQRVSAADVDSVHVGVYGGARWGGFGMNFGAAYARHDLATARSVVFPGFDETLSAEYLADATQAFGEASYQFKAGRHALQPFASLAYVSVNSDSFGKTGGAAALLARPNQTDVTYTTIGVRSATDFDFGTAEGTLTGMLGWRHAFGNLTPLSTLAFAGGDPFTVLGTIATPALLAWPQLNVGGA